MKKNIVFILLLISCSIVAQQSQLDKDVEQAIKNQARHVVDAFTTHLEYISDKQHPDSIKDYHIEASLDLFIARGNATLDENGNIITPAPIMEVSSVNSNKKDEYLVPIYLRRMKKLQYSKVILKTSSSYCVGELHPTGNDCEYETVLTVRQLFIGKNGDVTVYSDVTTKQYHVHIKCIRGAEVTRWQILLGDVRVETTLRGTELD